MSTYWQERFTQLEASRNAKSVQTYAEVEKQCIRAQRTLEAQINAWYGRFADNNKITIAEARKWLSNKELAELRWDVKDYIKYGKENALNGEWIKQLENASAKFHISRLEALKLQTQQTCEVLYGNMYDTIDTHMRSTYTNDYYHTAYEIQKGTRIGYDIASIDTKKLDAIMGKPWASDGKNFSERIWGSKQQLIQNVHTNITQMVMLGQTPDKAISNLAKSMHTSKSQAGRLIMTESAYFGSLSQKNAFNDLDVEKFEFVATLDSKTSEICRELDGKVFDMKDFEPGVNAPPMHVWCRSCTAPYFDDDFGVIGERAARGEDGKTYNVPANTTYPEWKKSFVDGENKKDFEPIKNSDIIKVEEVSAIRKKLESSNIEHIDVKDFDKKLTDTEIINRLGGGDMTKGSCSSLGFAYIGNKNGLDVLDFRDGKSREFFSSNNNIKDMLTLPDVIGSITKVQKEISGTMDIIKNLEIGKEYYLSVGRHASIIRNTENGVEYLELQSKLENGWISFNNNRYGSMYNTLDKRFGCRKTVDKVKVGSTSMIFEKEVVLMDVDSFKGNEEFKKILGYINTSVDKQKKGVSGDVR